MRATTNLQARLGRSEWWGRTFEKVLGISLVESTIGAVAERITWTGGDPGLVPIVVAETMRLIVDGLEPDDVDAQSL